MEERECIGCGEVFSPRVWNQKYCKRGCGVTPRACADCGTEFVPDHFNRTQTCCSRECMYRQIAVRNRTTQRVNKPGGQTEAEKDKLRRLYLDKGEGRTYRKLNGRHEHRAVAEEVLGRPLGKNEVVHHEDLDKRNNDPSNLFVFPTASWHTRHHNLGHPGLPTCDCECIRLKEVI